MAFNSWTVVGLKLMCSFSAKRECLHPGPEQGAVRKAARGRAQVQAVRAYLGR